LILTSPYSPFALSALSPFALCPHSADWNHTVGPLNSSPERGTEAIILYNPWKLEIVTSDKRRFLFVKVNNRLGYLFFGVAQE
jgi:hypothetical protein